MQNVLLKYGLGIMILYVSCMSVCASGKKRSVDTRKPYSLDLSQLELKHDSPEYYAVSKFCEFTDFMNEVEIAPSKILLMKFTPDTVCRQQHDCYYISMHYIENTSKDSQLLFYNGTDFTNCLGYYVYDDYTVFLDCSKMSEGFVGNFTKGPDKKFHFAENIMIAYDSPTRCKFYVDEKGNISLKFLMSYYSDYDTPPSYIYHLNEHGYE